MGTLAGYLVIVAVFAIAASSLALFRGIFWVTAAAMASKFYVQDLSDNADEVKATISTGLSVNHMITILIALFGGWIWQTLGIETLFILSAILGLCNSAYAATIKTRSSQKQ